ncbi:hypothetical protein CDEST_01977 [Colletotrichum destructivum]|uniref:Uncharacterized protein n=1 Tax=Colletotrichum destructivum TaxID=34406 RepID=A0AAX4I1N6_9PEZI|nr:hypothetical protein CDEST_01977 [Colletotrichum destructivum]
MCKSAIWHHLGWEDIAPWIEQLPHVRRNMPSQVLNEEFRKRTTILKFLEGAEFCPYQLVAKKYIESSLTSIDVIFRLAETMLALKGFKLDNVTPLEWFRQRLHEIINAEGSRFSLTMTILNFRHDPKYVKLRDLNGERTMGPSQTNDSNHDGHTTDLCWNKCIVDTVGTNGAQCWIAGDREPAGGNGCPACAICSEPVNFHLESERINEIRWFDNARKFEIVCKGGVLVPDKPRGNFLIEFKGEHTKKQFLEFCVEKSINLVNTKTHNIAMAGPLVSQTISRCVEIGNTRATVKLPSLRPCYAGSVSGTSQLFL